MHRCTRPHTRLKIEIRGSNFRRTLLKNELTDEIGADTYTYPCRRKHIFSMLLILKWICKHARVHTSTDCVNSSTVVGSFTRNADKSQHFSLNYKNSLSEVGCCCCCCRCLCLYVYVLQDSVKSHHSKVFFLLLELDVGHTHTQTHTRMHTLSKNALRPSLGILSPLCLITLGSMTVIW